MKAIIEELYLETKLNKSIQSLKTNPYTEIHFRRCSFSIENVTNLMGVLGGCPNAHTLIFEGCVFVDPNTFSRESAIPILDTLGLLLGTTHVKNFTLKGEKVIAAATIAFAERLKYDQYLQKLIYAGGTRGTKELIKAVNFNRSIIYFEDPSIAEDPQQRTVAEKEEVWKAYRELQQELVKRREEAERQLKDSKSLEVIRAQLLAAGMGSATAAAAGLPLSSGAASVSGMLDGPAAPVSAAGKPYLPMASLAATAATVALPAVSSSAVGVPAATESGAVAPAKAVPATVLPPAKAASATPAPAKKSQVCSIC